MEDFLTVKPSDDDSVISRVFKELEKHLRPYVNLAASSLLVANCNSFTLFHTKLLSFRRVSSVFNYIISNSFFTIKVYFILINVT